MKYIKKDEAYKIVLKHGSYVASAKIADLPSIDLVRCKECKHHEYEEPGMVYCPKIVGSWVSENWYCADGERREE
jgi:hypothetical protein